MAVQAIAALEDRIAFLGRPEEAWAREDAQRAVDEIRRAFGVRKMTEAELDAAHEQAMHELERMRTPDVPEALETYWREGR